MSPSHNTDMLEVTNDPRTPSGCPRAPFACRDRWRAVRRVAIVVLCLGLAHPVRGEGSTELVTGSYRLSCRLQAGDSVVVEVDIAAEATPLAGSRGMWGGDHVHDLTRHVRDLRVRWAGRDTPVSFSAFADLGQPDSMAIAVLGPRMLAIVVKGGDTSTGYVARLYFKGGVLKRRRVSLRNFESEFWEETRYSGPVRTN